MDAINNLATLLGTLAGLGILIIDIVHLNGRMIVGPLTRLPSAIRRAVAS